jgi:hypothetical protein
MGLKSYCISLAYEFTKAVGYFYFGVLLSLELYEKIADVQKNVLHFCVPQYSNLSNFPFD